MKMNPEKKCRKSLKSRGILFSYFCTNPETGMVHRIFFVQKLYMAIIGKP